MDISGMLQGVVDLFRRPSIETADGGHPVCSRTLIHKDYVLREDVVHVMQRTHTFDDIDSFARWLQRYASQPKRTEIFIRDSKITAGLAPQRPDGDLVDCLLAYHPLAQAWFNIMGKKLDQKAAIAHIRATIESFTTTSLLQEMIRFQVSFKGEHEFKYGDHGELLFQSHIRDTHITGEIPPTFNISVPIFLGIKNANGEPISYSLEILLDIHLDEDDDETQPMFMFTCPKWPIVKTEAIQDAAGYLQRILPAADGFEVSLGNYSSKAVSKTGEDFEIETPFRP
jgi:hypothetical protein